MIPKERVFILFVCLLSLLVLSGESKGQSLENQAQLQAEQSSQPTPPNSLNAPDVDTSPFSLLLKGFGIVAIFTLSLYLFLRLYKYLLEGRSAAGSGSPIRVLGSSVIGPKKTLCMVDVLDHVLVLGITDSQITVLLDIPAEKIDDRLKDQMFNNRKGVPTNFNSLMKGWLKKSQT